MFYKWCVQLAFAVSKEFFELAGKNCALCVGKRIRRKNIDVFSLSVLRGGGVERISVIGKGQARIMALKDIKDDPALELRTIVVKGIKRYAREFQDAMRRICFHRDSERGVAGTFQWLVEEVDALGETLKKKVMEDEFADVLAWLASLANVVNVDLEKAAIAKHDNTCPRCEPHFLHITSVRTIPRLLSRSSRMTSLSAGWKKLGQPQPASNLVSEKNSGSLQQRQW